MATNKTALRGKILLRNGKAGRLVKEGLEKHDKIMHKGMKGPSIKVTKGKGA